MSDTPPSSTPPTSSDEARLRRNKLLGRIIILGMGLLVLIQLAPLLLRWVQGRPL